MEDNNLAKQDLENIINTIDDNIKLHSLFGTVDSTMYKSLLEYSDLTDKILDIIYNSNNIEFLKDLFMSSISKIKFVYQNICDESFNEFNLRIQNLDYINIAEKNYTINDVIYYTSLSEVILKQLIKMINNSININENETKDVYIDYYNETLYNLYEHGIIYSYTNVDELLIFIEKIEMTQNIFSMILMYAIKYRNLELVKKFIKEYNNYNVNNQPIEYRYNDPHNSSRIETSFISKNMVIKKVSKHTKYNDNIEIEEIKYMYPIMYVLPYITYIDYKFGTTYIDSSPYMVTNSKEIFDYITSNINIDYSLRYNDFDLLNIAVYGIENVKNICYKDNCKKLDSTLAKVYYYGVSTEYCVNSTEAIKLSLYIINYILAYCDNYKLVNKKLNYIKFRIIKNINPFIYLFRCNNIAMAYNFYNYYNSKPEYFDFNIEKSYNIIKMIVRCGYYSYVYDINNIFDKYIPKNSVDIYLNDISKSMYTNIWERIINSTSMDKNNPNTTNYVDVISSYFNIFTDDNDKTNNIKNKTKTKTSYIMWYKYITGRDFGDLLSDIDNKVVYHSKIGHIYYTKNIWGKICMKYKMHKVYNIYLKKIKKMIKDIKKMS